eukprot:TRINITY_DN22663_c0_g1_i1.p1 TRINITY_DN22663_c0_g1~~TRINITY_DN22663_c0_g1_i1.p1  ORF type:complete len:156 (+),score=43.80 TRINITY_DN22663_c0_g1_i1:162-629(+)
MAHPRLSLALAVDLGLHKLTQKFQEVSSREIGSEFGQVQDISVAISGILKQYRFGASTIMELVQNADDAKASVLHILLDKRTMTHADLPPKYAELDKGPAIVVFNDAPFTEDDARSIQRVGLSGKVNDLTKSGSFGIGFNAVYHLTDAPSIVAGF